MIAVPQGQAQSTQSAESLSNLPEDHSPQGALWRAAVLPGWGQFYNRQYLKIPVVYAGLIGIGAMAVYANDQYYLFRNVHRYAQAPEEYPEYAALAEPFRREIETGRTDRLRQERERFRRYRDLSVVGFFAFHSFAVLDAYVSAHLLDFDVGEDLSVRFHSDTRGPGATLRIQL